MGTTTAFVAKNGVTTPGDITTTSKIISPSIGPTTGQQHTLPIAASDIIGLVNAVQTLTNKTLTSPTVNTPVIAGGTINNTVIGNTTPAAVTASTITTSGASNLLGAVTLGQNTSSVTTLNGTLNVSQAATIGTNLTVTGNINGNLTGTALNATNVNVIVDPNPALNKFITFVDLQTGFEDIKTNNNFTYNSQSGTLLTPNVTTSGNVTVGGNLVVNGTTTTVNSTTVTIDDPIFTVGGDTPPATDDNKDRGIEFRWHNGTTAKVGFFGFDDSTGFMTFIPDAVNTSEVFSGSVGVLDVSRITGSAATLTTPRTISLSGDVAGSVSFNGSADVTIAATIQPNSVALGTDTTGNYVATVAGTADQVLVSGAAGEGTATVLSLPQSIATTSSPTFTNITSTGNPTTSTHVINRDFYYRQIWKDPVRVVTTANISLAAPGTTIDGVTLANGESFLAAFQTTGSENGIYVFNGSAVPATRRVDADTSAKVVGGTRVHVMEGASFSDTQWVLTTNNPITLGTTALVFTESLSQETRGIAQLANVNGLITRTGLGTFVARNLASTGTGITITNADGVAGNPTVNSNATSANTANTIVSRDATGNFSAGTISASLLGNASTATIAVESGLSNRLRFKDNRSISPNEDNPAEMVFGFTSFANNNTTPYADYLHLRSYTDNSGGNDNLVMFRKDQIGMRIWQQTFGSASAYSAFKDVAWTDGTNITALSAGVLSGTIPSAVLGNSTAFVGTTAVALNRASANQALTGISSVALPGATSGTVTLTPAAVAGTTAITLPATSGTLVTTGDTGSVTSTMIADGTIVNADINAAAGIVDTKLATIATAGKVANTATTATSTNTANAIVARNASGNFNATAIDLGLNTGQGALLNSGIRWQDGTTYSAGVGASSGGGLELHMDQASQAIRFYSGTYPTPTLRMTVNDTGLVMAGANIITGNVTGNLTGNASTATTLQTARTISLSGDVTGSVSFNGGANADIAVTIQPNSVALGTDTTGSYVAVGAVSGNGLSGSANAETATFTVTSNATDVNTANTIVFRNASGNFSAGTITAALSGNATTATTATNQSGGTVNATTVTASGSASLNGGVSTTTIAYSGEVSSTATSALQVPVGTTAQRPTGANGKVRFNTTLNEYEGFNATTGVWDSLGGGAQGGGTDSIFYENGQTVNTNYTVVAGKNAMSAGPITIANGVTVTVATGARWVVV